MKFASVRLIAADMEAMVAFYELVTARTADWLAPRPSSTAGPLRLRADERLAVLPRHEHGMSAGVNRAAVTNRAPFAPASAAPSRPSC